MENKQIQTADFLVSGNLKMAYQYLKDMYDPPKKSDSGPIKRITQAEIDKERNQAKQNFIEELDPTIQSA